MGAAPVGLGSGVTPTGTPFGDVFGYINARGGTGAGTPSGFSSGGFGSIGSINGFSPSGIISTALNPLFANANPLTFNSAPSAMPSTNASVSGLDPTSLMWLSRFGVPSSELTNPSLTSDPILGPLSQFAGQGAQNAQLISQLMNIAGPPIQPNVNISGFNPGAFGPVSQALGGTQRALTSLSTPFNPDTSAEQAVAKAWNGMPMTLAGGGQIVDPSTMPTPEQITLPISAADVAAQGQEWAKNQGAVSSALGTGATDVNNLYNTITGLGTQQQSAFNQALSEQMGLMSRQQGLESQAQGYAKGLEGLTGSEQSYISSLMGLTGQAQGVAGQMLALQRQRNALLEEQQAAADQLNLPGLAGSLGGFLGNGGSSLISNALGAGLSKLGGLF